MCTSMKIHSNTMQGAALFHLNFILKSINIILLGQTKFQLTWVKPTHNFMIFRQLNKNRGQGALEDPKLTGVEDPQFFSHSYEETKRQ